MPPATYRFFYRQAARSAGLGMMMGAVVFAAAAYFFLFLLPFPRIPACIFYAFWCAGTAIFFVLGLRRVVYGGQWGCFLDDEYMSWSFPHRMGKQDQQFAVRDLLKFVVQIDRQGEDTRYSYFIETAEGRHEITVECFGRPERLGRALVAANPAIMLECVQHGQSQAWDPDHPPWAVAALFGQLFLKNR